LSYSIRISLIGYHTSYRAQFISCISVSTTYKGWGEAPDPAQAAHTGTTPANHGGSDSFITGLADTTLVTRDYSSPSLTGWNGKSGVSRLPCLSFRATDSGACYRAEYDCGWWKTKKPLSLTPVEWRRCFWHLRNPWRGRDQA